MHLKTLTLRGFKSFASATTLRFEPGVTCVVGPNGSGKSNVVDALAWVMGEQGAKSLRGGKMEDVIFAGTAGRAPLGRAEVSLTIDNSDGALPIDYTEVTISRTMFRNGGSEYAINGSSCRLLDIQELLSDTGMGREMHVIVGQGQLDTVLRATAEDRRGFIEEAAGVLKHRKRKEKAIRKLDAMQANLTRLTDLTAEIRRQLGPLGRQAEVARKAAIIRIDVRDARSRLLADELAQLTATLDQEKADETALLARRKEVEAELEAARVQMAELERQASEAAPALARAHEAWFSLSSLRERIGGVQSLATERMRLLGAEEPVERGQDPDELQQQADRAAAAEAELATEAGQRAEELSKSVQARETAEAAAAQAERQLADLARANADRREGIARLAGQVGAKRSAIAAAEAEISRLREAHQSALTRSETARVEFTQLETQVVGDEEGEEGLDAAHEEAVAALDSVQARLDDLRQQQETARRDHAAWTAKRDALELSLTRKDGAGHLLAEQTPGLGGSVAANITIEPGFEVAVAAVLGTLADGVVVDSIEHAVDAIRQLHLSDAGRAELLIAGQASAAQAGKLPSEAGSEARWLSDVVTISSAAHATVARLVESVVVVDDLAQARAVITADSALTAVTALGDVLSAQRAIGGSADGPTTLELQAAYDEATAGVTTAQQAIERSTFELEAEVTAHEEATQRYEQTLERLNDSDARLTAIAEQLGHLGQTARAADDEAKRLTEQIAALDETYKREQEELASLNVRLTNAERDPAQDEGIQTELQAERDERAAEATAARSSETEARLALRTVEERARALASRAQSLQQAAEAERTARAEAQRRHEQRMAQAKRAQTVASAAERVLGKIDVSLGRAEEARTDAEARRNDVETSLGQRRSAVESLTGTLRELTDHAHRDELARAQHQLRVEQLRERIVEDLSVDPDVLIGEHGPHQPIPVLDETGAQLTEDGEPQTIPYVREEQEKRLRKAERALKTLGNINPLALEEFAALEERHTFLGEQLADLKKSRADLLQIVEEIDEKVEAVFTEAYHDTAREFADIFPRLFPGGEGSLVLTDPENMLSTGIDVEARPAGKKVKRLSLLSGGERSLVAVALLVAIFKARPSPFYVMDEVEAALDDANLGRLLEIFTELRNNSQLIVVTHQKRTMEIADALYGVTMRGDGVTTVISQRLEA